MVSFKQLAVSAATVAMVSAADNKACTDSSATMTISAAGDGAIPCKTVEGHVAFATGAGVAGAVTLSGVQEIQGDLLVKNATQVITLGSSVKKIGGKLQIESVERLTGIIFNELEEVGSLSIMAAPQLENVQLGTKGVTKVGDVRLSNTFLSSFKQLDVKSVKSIQIDNNRRLKEWESSLTNVTDKLTIADNSADLQVKLDSLAYAGDIQMRGAKSLSLKSLKAITGSFDISNNTQMTSMELKNLTEVGQSFSAFGNKNLGNLTVPILKSLGGGLTIQLNDKLEKFTLEKLEKVGGAVNIRGNLTEVSLPELGDVKGTFDFISTEDASDTCSAFQKLKSGGEIQGKLTCTVRSTDSTKGGSKPLSEGASTTKDDGSSSDDEGAAFSVGTNMYALAALAVAGVAAHLL
jgi:hypothetical protein